MSTHSKSFNSHDRQKTTIEKKKMLVVLPPLWMANRRRWRESLLCRFLLVRWSYVCTRENIIILMQIWCDATCLCSPCVIFASTWICWWWDRFSPSSSLLFMLESSFFFLSLVSLLFLHRNDWQKHQYSRKDLSLKDSKIDILLITGMLSPYASVVEKLHRDVNKERVTMLKVERAGDVLVDAVSPINAFTTFLFANI